VKQLAARLLLGEGLAGNRDALFFCRAAPDNAAMALTAQLTHFGVHATDLDRMVDFYTRVMGFIVSDSGTGRSGARVFFMTQNPECHHQFVLFDGRPGDMTYNPVNQISFRLDSLDTLKAYRKALIAEGITEHCDTPFYTPQPCGEPLDLDESNDEILQRTEAMCRSRPRFATRDAWMQGIQAKLDARP
jgi:catechol 2,3-dioxygenase-like lactoylglutathione lyase family enzyme